MRFFYTLGNLLICNVLFAQNEPSSCGTERISPGEQKKRRYIGNNAALIQKMKDRGFEMPADDFDHVDPKGLYKGRRMKMTEARPLKNRRYGQRNKKNGSRSSSNTIYVPLRVWNHKNSSGVAAFSRTQVETATNGMLRMFRQQTGGAIEFYIKQITYPNNSRFYN